MNDAPRTGSYFEGVTPPNAAVTLADGAPALAPVHDEFERGSKIDRYLALERLGVGGMGVVLAAYDPKLDRRVALKLLRGPSNNPENHARMLREAQALAKLSHPAVVSVYDVGEAGDRIFIAMEFIDGPDLRRWLKTTKPGVDVIVRVFRGAAKGLQAAHDAGIIHRDFKPDNVLIGSDGRPRVTDFGLALAAAAVVPSRDPHEAISNPSDPRLTATGMVMGTPAYMAVEQHRGQVTDHRSDQFAFCVSLFEALYGIRPFSGATGNEYCAAIERGELPQPATSVSVPRRVHAAIVRGLSAKPEDRFPSMRAFLRATTPPTRSRKTWVVGGIGGLALGATAVALVDPPEETCSGFSARAAAVYGDGDRREILAAFSATELPYAPSTFEASTRLLDAFTQEWVGAATEACMASERGEQSDRMLDLRMQCLDRGLQRLEATVGALLSVDRSNLERASELTARLPSLEPCSDPNMLGQRGFLPENEAQRADAEELLPKIEQASTLAWFEQTEDARALIEPLEARIEASTHPRVRALYAELLGRTAPIDEAPQHYRRAVQYALQYNLDDIASASSVRAAYLAKDAGAFDVARSEYLRGAALARSAGMPILLVDALMGLAKLAESQLHYDAAIGYATEAREILEDDDTPENLARALLMVSSNLMQRDGPDAGLEELQRARAILVAEVGVSHPAQEEYLQEVLKRANARGDAERAVEASEELLTLLRRNRGPGSTREAVALANLATSYLELGRLDDALDANARADELLRASYGDDYPDRGGVLNNRGELLLHLGRLDDARATLKKAREMFEARLGPGTEATAIAQINLAEVERRAGRLDIARTHAREALDILLDALGPEHPRVARAHLALAEVELLDGNSARALRLLTKARSIGSPKPDDMQLLSLLHAEATLRMATSSDTARATALAEVQRERERLIEGAPSSLAIAETLGRIDALTDAP